jgi:hypothetical protein
VIKIEHVETFGWETAVRGMRNPLNSWEKSDSLSYEDDEGATIDYLYNVGRKDKELMTTLVKAGTDHSKFLRMIGISMDITSHQVWWAEFDTYKVGTVRNSCSKMHTIHIKSFEPGDFSHEGIDEVGGTTKAQFMNTLAELEHLRVLFNETKEKKYWRAIIELLPSGYNIRATVTLNYAVARNQYHARKNHKLDEWHDYCKMLEALPLSNLITMEAQKE